MIMIMNDGINAWILTGKNAGGMIDFIICVKSLLYLNAMGCDF